jgi:hypothetical protein
MLFKFAVVLIGFFVNHFLCKIKIENVKVSIIHILFYAFEVYVLLLFIPGLVDLYDKPNVLLINLLFLMSLAYLFVNLTKIAKKFVFELYS